MKPLLKIKILFKKRKRNSTDHSQFTQAYNREGQEYQQKVHKSKNLTSKENERPLITDIQSNKVCKKKGFSSRIERSSPSSIRWFHSPYSPHETQSFKIKVKK